jgi:hypothetical protein
MTRFYPLPFGQVAELHLDRNDPRPPRFADHESLRRKLRGRR